MPIIALILGGWVVFADWYAVSPNGSAALLTLQPFAAVLIPVVFALKGAFNLYRKPTGRQAIGYVTGWVILIVVFFFFARAGRAIRKDAFVALAARSTPLIAAIKQYEQTNGASPPSLEALVPQFLLAVPTTGLGAYPHYKYQLAKENLIDGNPWKLSVFTPTGILDFDEFFHYPLQNYTSYSWDTNPVERIADWAYLHE